MRITKYSIASIYAPNSWFRLHTTMNESKYGVVSAKSVIEAKALKNPMFTITSNSKSEYALPIMNDNALVSYIARGSKASNAHLKSVITEYSKAYTSHISITDNDISNIVDNKLASIDSRISLLVKYSPDSKSNNGDIKLPIKNGFSTTENGTKYTIVGYYDRARAKSKKTHHVAVIINATDISGNVITEYVIALTKNETAKAIRINNITVWPFIKNIAATYACNIAHKHAKNNKTAYTCRMELVNIATGIAV